MKCLDILFLTQVLPYPLDAGPKVRAYYTLRHLAGRGHRVTLLSFVRGTDAPERIEHLRGFCERVITVPIERTIWRSGKALGRSLLTGEPILITRDRVAMMFEYIRKLVAENNFNAIHSDQLWMAPYALAARRGEQQCLVLDQHNAVYLVPHRLAMTARNPLTRLAYRRESTRLAAYERQTCLAFDRVVTVTPQDKEYLLELYCNDRRPHFVATIPICLDPDSVPVRQQPSALAETLFVGGMHWPPNADGVSWFMHQVLPRVKARVPGVRFTAVGTRAPKLVPGDGQTAYVNLPGHVADLQPYWERSSVFVVPLRAGGGMRVKILDAWARGVPVVSSRIGAEGLDCTDGKDLLLANTVEDFSAAVIRLLQDRSLAEQLARGGRETVERLYDWRQVYAAWDNVYDL